MSQQIIRDGVKKIRELAMKEMEGDESKQAFNIVMDVVEVFLLDLHRLMNKNDGA